MPASRTKTKFCGLAFWAAPTISGASISSISSKQEIETDVHGPGWERFLQPSKLLRIHGAVRGEEMLRTLRRYRVQLNFFRPHNGNSHNMRSFEVPAAGGIMLAEDSIEHRAFFQNGREAFFFNNTTEMVNLARHLLALPKDEADGIRFAARRRSVAGGYSYRERATAAMAEIDKARRMEGLSREAIPHAA